MLLRLSVIGMLGLLLTLGSGCKPCCSEGTSGAKSALADGGSPGGCCPVPGDATAAGGTGAGADEESEGSTKLAPD
jgi:hypothetical protein